jgi:hypothetical protein
MVIIAILMIMISKLNIKIKIVVVYLIIGIYYKTLYLVTMIIFLSIRSMQANKKSDKQLSEHVKKLYKTCGLNIVTNFDKFKSRPPTILLANYCRDRVENSSCILVPRKLAIMMQVGFKQVNMSEIINKPIYVHGKGTFEDITNKIKNAHEEGNDIFVYINSPSYFDYITRYKSGIFHIAKQLNISITPLSIDYINTNLGTIPTQNFCMKIGNPSFISNIYLSKYKIRKFHTKYQLKFQQVKFHHNLTSI